MIALVRGISCKKKREKEEAEKWKNVPAWKRKLLVEKAKESDQKSEEEMKKAADEEANRKRRAKEAEEERKARIKEQQEMEKKMQEEMQELPEWKREIMMKRGGAIKNWADEREGQNDQEIAEQERLAAEEEARAKPPSPVPQQAKYPAQPSKHVEPSKHVAPTKHVPNTTIPVQGSGGHVQNSPAAQPAKKQAAVKADTDNQVPKVFAQKATLVLKQQNQPDVVKSSAPPPSVDEGKLEEDWDSLPLWKREIMMKRGGAIKNWGDEREQVNVQGE
ncbi:hypothetical protein DPMN_131867 [Dreissena polymorpha]|uniref:Uncharacterized protein n=1 Tax=Dreissena polymorpha TaxID=45954 RepID=A0A9D4JD79_DREPO|nr:hypothetical protein DPMN_131867 [Dreissena polymorpha]